MKPQTVLVFFLCWAGLTNAGQVSPDDIKKSIDIQGLTHPYLIFSAKEKPELLKRIQSDNECRDIMKALLVEGNRLLYQPVDYHVPQQGRNPRAGWTEADRDKKYEAYYGLHSDNALRLAFLYQMTGDQRYADKAYEFADAFCELTTWTMRPHEFPIIYSRVMPWNVPDDQVCFSFDHYNGDAGRDMAYVYDWLYPALSQPQRDRIRGALIEKVITRVRGNYEFHWWATAYRCNWCGVCNSGVGMAALALLKEHPQFVDVIMESYHRIDRMLSELGIDGGWQEGGSYWSYALRTSVQFAKALQRASKGEYDLFQNPRLKAHPADFPLYLFVPSARSINFADSGSRLIGPTFLLNLLAAETGDASAIWYRQNVLGEGHDWQDIVWPRPEQVVPPPDKKSKHFRTIDYWVLRSDFTDPDQVIVAGKAGKNDDPHHGHLDVGQVVVFWRDCAFISEIGRAIYDEKYFDEVRWDYPQASSLGHNLIFVNGEKQIPGKHFKQPFNYDVGGKVLMFETTPQRDYVLMDPSNAYPGKELKGWRRHVLLDKSANITLILDEVRSRKAAEIEARFHSEAKIVNEKNYVLLQDNGVRPAGRRRQSDGVNDSAARMMKETGTMVWIPLLNTNFAIHQDRHAYLPVQATAELEWIPYYSLITQSVREKTVLTYLILPVENSEQAQQLAASTGLASDGEKELTVSLVYKDKPYAFVFRAEKEGLILQH